MTDSIECNILLKDLGWFTLIPKEMKIDFANMTEIAGRLMEMDNGVKQVSFRRNEYK